MRNSTNRHATWSVLLLLVSAAPPLLAQPSTTADVKVRFPDEKKLMAEKSGTLALDDATRRLTVKCGDHPLEVKYDDVKKVVVEVNTFGSKAGFGSSFLGFLAGGAMFGTAITTALDKPFDNDHLVYLEIATSQGTQPYLVNVERASVPRVLRHLQAAFGGRVSVPVFDAKQEFSEKFTGKQPNAKARSIATAKKHPIPDVRSDKALVVIVMPATIMRQSKPEKPGSGAFVYVDGEPAGTVLVGSYTYLYAEPGEHAITSWVNGQVGVRMNLEAGKEYGLTQTLYAKGMMTKTILSPHSKELVAYEMSGALYTETISE